MIKLFGLGKGERTVPPGTQGRNPYPHLWSCPVYPGIFGLPWRVQSPGGAGNFGLTLLRPAEERDQSPIRGWFFTISCLVWWQESTDITQSWNIWILSPKRQLCGSTAGRLFWASCVFSQAASGRGKTSPHLLQAVNIIPNMKLVQLCEVLNTPTGCSSVQD